ncbi:hypothetical protein PENTCL1PPCAC_15988, partial [Pristionchus entomophagus]
MAVPSYAWFYEDPFHSFCLTTTTTISVMSNGLLLYIIFTAASIGHYRYLLAVFAVCDVLTSIGHTALQPNLHMTTTGLYFFPRHGPLMIGIQSYDFVCCMIFVATYYQTFLILSYHYVYRLRAVTSDITRTFAEHWKLSHWISLAVLINIMYIAGFVGTCTIAFMPSFETRALVPPEIEEFYGIDLRNPNRGFAGIVLQQPDPLSGEMKWHGLSVAATMVLNVLFGGTASVIVYCMWRTNAIIRSSTNLTAKTRQMQQSLFHALLIQV